MKIAVCDDDAFELKLIYRNLKLILSDLEITAEIVCFISGQELSERVLGGERYMLYLLDIMLEEGRDGISIAKEICTMDAEAKIAFLTGSREYAVEAFELGAVHYILKPVTERGVRAIVERWMQTGGEGKCLAIRHGKEIRKFPRNQILYMKSKDRGIEIHMRHHKWDSWVKFPFHAIEEEMCDSVSFVKISRGCIVNLEHVSRMDCADCFLNNGEVLSISRREYSSVRNSYNEFLYWKMKRDGR